MQARLAVTFPALIGVYAIVPALALLALADSAFFNGALRSALPRDPEHFFLYLLLFNVPHHVGSLVSFADAEYLARYRRQLLALPLVWLATALCFLYAPLLALVVFIVYTEYHTLNQQVGIAGAFVQKRLRYLGAWRWCTVALMAAFYAASTYPQLLAGSFSAAVVWTAVAVCVLQAGLTLTLFRQIDTGRGRIFFIAIVMSFAGAALALALGYPLIAVFMSRFVHDVTAFMVYAVHDRNRNLLRRHNLVYRALAPLPVPLLALTPLIAVLIAAPLTFGPAGSLALLLLFMTHYYVEGIIWRRGTPHRARIAFAP